jgi:uncharacterized protein YjbJ (UPF0337 family)
MRDQKRQVGR